MSKDHFTDSALSRPLYTGERQRTRTTALNAAKVSGGNVADQIAALVSDIPHDAVVDVGCGRGTTTHRITTQAMPKLLFGVDLSRDLLAQASRRYSFPSRTQLICANFTRLPFGDSSIDCVIAAFCLYHAPEPVVVLRELSRVTRPGGRVVIATKSVESYAELSGLVSTGLTTSVQPIGSLYKSFCNENAVANCESVGLDMDYVDVQAHKYRFTEPRSLAAYVSTIPLYEHLGDSLQPVIREPFRAIGSTFAMSSSVMVATGVVPS